jgi:hypothetical protein
MKKKSVMNGTNRSRRVSLLKAMEILKLKTIWSLASALKNETPGGVL